MLATSSATPVSRCSRRVTWRAMSQPSIAATAVTATTASAVRLRMSSSSPFDSARLRAYIVAPRCAPPFEIGQDPIGGAVGRHVLGGPHALVRICREGPVGVGDRQLAALGRAVHLSVRVQVLLDDADVEGAGIIAVIGLGGRTSATSRTAATAGAAVVVTVGPPCLRGLVERLVDVGAELVGGRDVAGQADGDGGEGREQHQRQDHLQPQAHDSRTV